MDFLGLISSVSRLAIAAFVITLVVVSYEVFLIARRRHSAPVKDASLAVPEFTQDAKPGTFSPVVVGESAKQPFTLASRKISRSYVYVLLGLLVMIVIGGGFLVYKRNTLSSPDVQVTKVPTAMTPSASPLPSSGQTIPERDPFLSGGEVVSITPQLTEELSPTVTASPTSATTLPTQTTPVSNQNSTSVTPLISVSPRGTSITGTVSLSPTNAQLPQSGSYQTTLIISVVSIAVIYLALIL